MGPRNSPPDGWTHGLSYCSNWQSEASPKNLLTGFWLVNFNDCINLLAWKREAILENKGCGQYRIESDCFFGLEKFVLDNFKDWKETLALREPILVRDKFLILPTSSWNSLSFQSFRMAMVTFFFFFCYGKKATVNHTKKLWKWSLETSNLLPYKVSLLFKLVYQLEVFMRDSWSKKGLVRDGFNPKRLVYAYDIGK